MNRKLRLAVRNSILLIMDPRAGEVPASLNGGLVACTASCIAIGTVPEQDGETAVLLTDEPVSPGTNHFSVFDGTLKTPSRELAVCSVWNEVLLSIQVFILETRVRVWANHTSEPDSIVVIATAGAADT